MVRISWYMNWTWRVNNLSTEMVWNATCHSDWSYLLREDNNGVHLNLEASDLLCQRVQQSFILGPAIGLHLALHVVQIWYSIKGHVHWAVTGMSCPSWQWHRTGSRWSPVRTLPVAPLWYSSRTVVEIKLRRTSALQAPMHYTPRINLIMTTMIIVFLAS